MRSAVLDLFRKGCRNGHLEPRLEVTEGFNVQINASSLGDLIGQINPVSSIDYSTVDQATFSTAFQLSNVISGNGGNGIGISVAIPAMA